MNPMMAARLYSTVQGGSMPTSGVQQANPAAQGAGFADMLKSVVTQTAEQTRGAEAQMAQNINGQGNLIDVVTSISAAEASLETVLAVRDQVISAYQEIMRMPI